MYVFNTAGNILFYEIDYMTQNGENIKVCHEEKIHKILLTS